MKASHIAVQAQDLMANSPMIIAAEEKGERKMRDRLIELVNKFDELDFFVPPNWWIEHIADYLLANGVIVPPCKVGDILYRLETPSHIQDDTYLITEFGVNSQYFSEGGKITIFIHRIWKGKPTTSYEVITNRDIGKTFFLTREEAEKALERRKNGRI